MRIPVFFLYYRKSCLLRDSVIYDTNYTQPHPNGQTDKIDG